MSGAFEEKWGLEDTHEETLENEIDAEGAHEGTGAEEEGVNTYVDGGDPTEAEGAEEPTEGEGGEGQSAEGGFDPETQAAIQREAERIKNAFIEKEFAGVINPYTKQPIRTEADLQAYREAFQMDQRRQQLQDMGVDADQLDQIVNNLPQVQQANQIIKQQQTQAANEFAKKEFAALKKEFPDCGLEKPEELWDTEAGRKALDLWSKGVSMVDAYAATHRAEIRQRQSAAAKQSALNEMNSKNHLKQTKGNAGTAVEIPKDAKENLKAWFPEASDAEIAEMYRKNHMNDK